MFLRLINFKTEFWEEQSDGGHKEKTDKRSRCKQMTRCCNNRWYLFHYFGCCVSPFFAPFRKSWEYGIVYGWRHTSIRAFFFQSIFCHPLLLSYWKQLNVFGMIGRSELLFSFFGLLSPVLFGSGSQVSLTFISF